MNPSASVVLVLSPGIPGELLRELVAADSRVEVLAEAPGLDALHAVLLRAEPDAVVLQAPSGTVPPEMVRLLAEFPRVTLLSLAPDGSAALICALRLVVERLDDPAPAALLDAIRAAAVSRAWFPLPHRTPRGPPAPRFPGAGGPDLPPAGPGRRVHSAGRAEAGTSVEGPRTLAAASALTPAAPTPQSMPTVATLQYNQAVTDLLAALAEYVPTPLASTPAASLGVVSVRERSVGIGNLKGPQTRPGFSPEEVFGGRVEAVVRFEVWNDAQADLLAATATLQARLRTDRDLLRAQGFLRIHVTDTSPADPVDGGSLWRQTVLCEVLYEYEYRDPDAADSLIARIPVGIEGPHAEAMLVTGGMARWDDREAPPLVVRGPGRVGALAALAFVPGPPPSGSVVLVRTFDGAPGAPAPFATLGGFLAASAGGGPEARHASVAFTSLQALLDAAAAAGSPVRMGDWDEDAAADEYAGHTLALDPPVRLAGAADRLELRHEHAALDAPAVVYLRAMPGSA